MKSYKIIIFSALVFLLSNNIVSAQYVGNAIKFSQSHYEGTARGVAMGNAFTGLGGEIGAININPASAGLYRYSEYIITPALGTTFNNSNYLNNNSKDNRTRFNLSNIGFITPFNTGRSSGLVNFNIGINVNTTNDYDNRSYTSGTNSESSWLSPQAVYAGGINNTNLDITEDYDPFFESNAPWKTILLWNSSLLDNLPSSNTEYIGATENLDDDIISLGGPVTQEFYQVTNGSKTQYDINFSGNISNKFFFGMNLGIQNINYTYLETYSETAVNPENFSRTGFNNFTHEYRESTSGSGFNMNFGIIYKPIKGLSLGAAISTPTWLYLRESWEETITSNLDAIGNTDAYSKTLASPIGEYDYRLNTPFKWSAGISYLFNQRMVVSFDYENLNYGSTELVDANYIRNTFEDENKIIRNNYNSVNNFRAGMEIRVTESFSFRGGYNYYDYIGNDKSISNLHIGSLGLGINAKSGFFADLAYQQYFPTKESFWLYDDIQDEANNSTIEAPTGTLDSWKFKIYLSLGFRF